MSTYKISDEGLALIKHFEGLELEAYHDVVGVLTIGYGSTGEHVHEGKVITESEAEDLLKRDLMRFEKAVNEALKAPASQKMYDAFVCLAFNIGTTAFVKSTALKRHNNGDYMGAHEAISWWNKARTGFGGRLQVLAGLVRRREAERELYLEGIEDLADGATFEEAEDTGQVKRVSRCNVVADQYDSTGRNNT